MVTKRGRRIEADAVIMGTGAMPDVMLARAAGLELGRHGGIHVDSRLRTSAPGIYAAGDVAEYESVIHGGRRMRIEHWDVAFNQGKTAALNMLGADRPHDVVPYFFSDLSDWASLEYVGPALRWDREVVRGSIDGGEFSVFYLQDGHVAGALSVGRSDDLDHARRWLQSRRGDRRRRGRARRPVDRSSVDLTHCGSGPQLRKVAIVGSATAVTDARQSRRSIADWCNWQHG